MCIIFEPHPLPHSECTLDSFPPVLVPPTGRCKRRKGGRDTSANSQMCFGCFLKMGDVNRKYLFVSWWNSPNVKERRFTASFITFFDRGYTERSFFVVVVVLGNDITRSRPIITATYHQTTVSVINTAFSIASSYVKPTGESRCEICFSSCCRRKNPYIKNLN